MTTILHDPPMRLRPAPLVLLLLAPLLGCASTDAAPAPELTGAERVKLAPRSTETASPTAPDGNLALTHVGRTVLLRSAWVLRARVASISPPLHGAAVGRAEVLEALRGEPESERVTLLAGEAAAIPDPGREAILFVDPIPGSPNVRLVQSVPLWDDDATSRAEALRRYLAIEELAREDRGAAAAELVDYLRRAVRSADEWTRWNAAEEYASLARAHPQLLGPDDAAALGAAVSGSRDAAFRRRVGAALDAIPKRSRADSTSASGTPAAGESAGESTASIDDETVRAWLDRFEAADEPDERRAVLVEAVEGPGAALQPLFDRALTDAHPVVRDTAVVAVARLELSELGGRLVQRLADEEHPRVRSSLVRAVGLLRTTEAVPLLSSLATAGDEGLREAWFALARIRSEDCLATLRALQSSRTGEDRSTLEFLLSDAFVEQERALGRRP